MPKDYNLGDIQSGAAGMDAFFASDPTIVTPVSSKPETTKTAAARPHRIRVGSLAQLDGFQRVSAETLVNRATQDLWALKKDDKSNFYIERLFDDSQPLKG